MEVVCMGAVETAEVQTNFIYLWSYNVLQFNSQNITGESGRR